MICFNQSCLSLIHTQLTGAWIFRQNTINRLKFITQITRPWRPVAYAPVSSLQFPPEQGFETRSMKLKTSGRVSQWNCTVPGQWAPFPRGSKTQKRSVIFQEARHDGPFNAHFQQYRLSLHSLSRYKNLFSMSSKQELMHNLRWEKNTLNFYCVGDKCCAHLAPSFPNTLSTQIMFLFLKKTAAKGTQYFCCLRESYWWIGLLASFKCLGSCSSRNPCQCPLGTSEWVLISGQLPVFLDGLLCLVWIWSV